MQDRRGRVAAYPCQRPGLPEALGLSREMCEQAAWAIAPDGRQLRGAAAVHAALSWALGWPGLLLLYRLPVLRQAEDLAYAAIARNRARLPGAGPHCRDHPDDCLS